MRPLLTLFFALTAALQAEHQGKIQILLLGDSTTEAKIPKLIAPREPQLEHVIEALLATEGDLPPVRVINAGLSGEYIRRLLDSGRYEKAIAKLPGLDFVFIRYGLNDIGRRDGFDSNFVPDFQELIAGLRRDHPKALLIPTTVIPYHDEAKVRKINALVREAAAKEKLSVFDLHPRYASELKRGPDMLNYRRFPLASVPPKLRPIAEPFVHNHGSPHVVVLDNRLDAQFGRLPGWFDDRHPNLAGYRVIADETAKFVAPLIRERFGAVKVASQPLPRAVDRNGLRPVPVITALDHCAWPNLKILKDGRTLAAFIFNNPSHGHRPGDIECWMSTDGGLNWKLASAVTQHEPDTIRMNHAAGVASNGDLIVLTSGWSNRWPAGQPRTRGSYRYEVLGPWLSRSPDGGHSWFVDTQAFPQNAPSSQPAVPFGDVQIADNGDLCVAIYAPQAAWEKYEERKFRSWLYRSSDGGRTWADPVVIGPDSNETTPLHVGGGRWLAAARGGTGVEKKDYVELYASSDDGRTWTCKYGITGFQHVNGHLLKLRDGRVLFCYGDRASDAGKKGIEARISADGGETWSRPVRVIDWNGLDGGYPSSVQRGDGQIVTAYYASALPGEAPDSAGGYHMEVVIWDADKTFATSR